ncbi:MAG: hypothetical protein PHP06_10420 [Clostridia bacterium]|nr:hypothetical protein [Clostridia bacterium]
MDCKNAINCPIYNMFKTDLLKNIYIRKYCTSNFEDCERYKLKRSNLKVPQDLLPDGKRLSDIHKN